MGFQVLRFSHSGEFFVVPCVFVNWWVDNFGKFEMFFVFFFLFVLDSSSSSLREPLSLVSLFDPTFCPLLVLSLSESFWRCPDPGCKTTNSQEKEACTQCTLPRHSMNQFKKGRTFDTTRVSSFQFWFSRRLLQPVQSGQKS